MVRKDPKNGSGWCGVISKPHRIKHSRSTRAAESSRVGGFSGKWLIFEVADTGVGVGEEGLRALFKEFIQVEQPLHTFVSLSGSGCIKAVDLLLCHPLLMCSQPMDLQQCTCQLCTTWSSALQQCKVKAYFVRSPCQQLV